MTSILIRAGRITAAASSSYSIQRSIKVHLTTLHPKPSGRQSETRAESVERPRACGLRCPCLTDRNTSLSSRQVVPETRTDQAAIILRTLRHCRVSNTVVKQEYTNSRHRLIKRQARSHGIDRHSRLLGPGPYSSGKAAVLPGRS